MISPRRAVKDTSEKPGQLSPSMAMQNQLTTIDGQIHPVTVLGRWIARAQGSDDAELKREAKQRKLQEERAGMYSSGGDRDGDGLLDYRQLYALWERQNWKATELDFSVDREQWVVTPREAQESTIWSLGSFYVGEERVTADLAPFLLAAPSGEVELFLATQLVDEARHAAFFDRFGAEVMCLTADDFRGRMRCRSSRRRLERAGYGERKRRPACRRYGALGSESADARLNVAQISGTKPCILSRSLRGGPGRGCEVYGVRTWIVQYSSSAYSLSLSSAVFRSCSSLMRVPATSTIKRI